MASLKSWQLTVTRDLICRQANGTEVSIPPGTYTLSELTDISYSLSDKHAQRAKFLVSQIATYLANGAMHIEGRWP